MTRLHDSRHVQLALVGFPVLLIAGLALVYTFFAYPASDDFCRAAVDRGSALRQTALLYEHWTGRWLTSLYFSWLTPRIGIFGSGYGLALILALGVWLAAFRLAAGLLLGETSSGRDRWILTALLFAVFWSGAPGISEVVYWLSGAFEYAVPFALLLGSLRLLAQVDRSGRGFAAALAAGGIGVLTSGGHEFAGALGLAAALSGIIALLFLGRNRVAACWALAAALMIGGLALNQLAPGNAVRSALFPFANDVGRSLRITFAPETTPLRWLADPRLLGLTGLLLLAPGFRALQPRWLAMPLPWLLVIPVITVAAVLTGWFLAAFGLGFPPPERLQALLYAVFVIGWTATVLAAAAHLRARNLLPAARGLPLTAAAAIFGLALVLSANPRAAVRDLPYAAGDWLQRNEDMFAAAYGGGAGRTDLVLRRPVRTPRLLVGQSFSEDPSSHGNLCLAKLLRVQSVRAAPGEGTRRIWQGE